ncbi:MAG TPA: hypothetical protein VLF71_04875 [Candidatus Saccharimonadales bacterium]|nr:hypothetical protein [Candidatus Saccharimonadales bacterium]
MPAPAGLGIARLQPNEADATAAPLQAFSADTSRGLYVDGLGAKDMAA